MTDTLASFSATRPRPTIMFVTDAAGPLVAAVEPLGEVVLVRTADAADQLAVRTFDVVVLDERADAGRPPAARARAADVRPPAVCVIVGGVTAGTDSEATVLPASVAPATLHAVCAMALRCAASSRRALDLGRENARLRGPDAGPEGGLDDLGRVERYEGIFTRSPAMARVLAFLQRVEGGEAPLVVQGEAGTGKLCVARAIQARSRRRHAPFVVATLGGLSDRDRDSLLFGHLAGAGPDGPGAADGRLVEADGGTLYVSDIADASPSLQLALLRVLEDGTFVPVGGDRRRRVNVRILSGTRRSLDELVRQGLFRRDLAERLRVATLALPALRDRPEDVFLFARHFLAMAALAMGRKAPGLSREARAVLESHHWPGNLRELRNVMERAAIVCQGGLVIAADLPVGGTRPSADVTGLRSGATIAIPAGGASLRQLEREIFLKTLAIAGGNQSRAAHILGLCESTFRFRLHKLGIASRRTPTKTSQLAATAPLVARA